MKNPPPPPPPLLLRLPLRVLVTRSPAGQKSSPTSIAYFRLPPSSRLPKNLPRPSHVLKDERTTDFTFTNFVVCSKTIPHEKRDGTTGNIARDKSHDHATSPVRIHPSCVKRLLAAWAIGFALREGGRISVGLRVVHGGRVGLGKRGAAPPMRCSGRSQGQVKSWGCSRLQLAGCKVRRRRGREGEREGGSRSNGHSGERVLLGKEGRRRRRIALLQGSFKRYLSVDGRTNGRFRPPLQRILPFVRKMQLNGCVIPREGSLRSVGQVHATQSSPLSGVLCKTSVTACIIHPFFFDFRAFSEGG